MGPYMGPYLAALFSLCGHCICQSNTGHAREAGMEQQCEGGPGPDPTTKLRGARVRLPQQNSGGVDPTTKLWGVRVSGLIHRALYRAQERALYRALYRALNIGPHREGPISPKPKSQLRPKVWGNL